MTPHLEILKPAQRAFWDRTAASTPKRFVLYGGTAVALRYGHRQSVDFDYSSDRPLDRAQLETALPAVKSGLRRQESADSLTVRIEVGGRPVNLSFFGRIGFGRVGRPDAVDRGATIASPIDLLATKLETLHDRIEARDYLDIEALLRSGLTLNQGLAAAAALFGRGLNPLDTAKAVAWFKDGGLDKALPESTRTFLVEASASFDPRAAPVRLASRSLSPTTQRIR